MNIYITFLFIYMKKNIYIFISSFYLYMLQRKIIKFMHRFNILQFNNIIFKKKFIAILQSKKILQRYNFDYNIFFDFTIVIENEQATYLMKQIFLSVFFLYIVVKILISYLLFTLLNAIDLTIEILFSQSN